MQLSQSALLYLCCASFLAGVLLAFLYDLLYMSRLWLIPPCNRYTIPSIQKLRAKCVTGRKMEKNKTKSFQIALFLEDIIFCIFCALAVILLLYWLNDGAFRIAAPICMAVGFLLWRISLSRAIRIALQWLAFAIESLIYTLLLPLKYLFDLIIRVYKRNVQKQKQKQHTKRRQRYTKQVFQNINRTAEALLPIDEKTRTQKGETGAKQRKKAV